MSRRKRVLLHVAFVLVIVALVVHFVEPAYWAIVTKRKYTEDRRFDVPSQESGDALSEVAHVRGWYSVRRWPSGEREEPCGYDKFWYVKTGFVAYQGWFTDDVYQETWWSLDGSLRIQQTDASGDDVADAEPWRWVLSSQRAPSAPDWVTDDTKWKQRMEAQAR